MSKGIGLEDPEGSEKLSLRIRIINKFVTNKLYKFKKGFGLIISGSELGKLQIWNRRSGDKLMEIKTVKVMKIVKISSPIYLTGDYDGYLRLWDLNRRNELLSYKGHSEGIKDIVRLKSDIYATSGNDMMVRTWFLTISSPPKLVLLKELSGHEGSWVDVMCLLQDGRLATSCGKAIKLWNWEEGSCLQTFTMSLGGISSLLQTANGQFIVFGTSSSNLAQVDLQTGEVIKKFNVNCGGSNWSKVLAQLTDGRITFLETGYKIGVMDLQTEDIIYTEKFGSSVDQIMLLEGMNIASAHGNGEIRIWKVGEDSISLLKIINQEHTDRMITLNKDFMHLLTHNP